MKNSSIRLLVCLIIATLVFSVMAIGTFAEEVTGLSGAGTETEPYLINDLAELKWFRDQVNAGNNYSGKYVALTANIDLGSAEWTPIGNSTNKFEGYFDGRNHTVSNLVVTGSNRYVGFFGYIKGSSMTATATPTVQNLVLDNVSVNGDYYVGGLAGQGYTCNVANVTVNGDVSGVRYVGGLIGHVYTYFSDCNFKGNASCTFDALGGIAGAGDCRAYNCSVIGDIIGSNWVGGIVGNGQEGTSAVGCYVKGTVSTDSNWYFGVGGIAGVGGHGYSSSEFKNNYFDGEVYLCGEKVNAIVTGIVNASNDEIQTTVDGNSWNTDYYDVDTPVYVVGDVPANGTAADWEAGAVTELTTTRNNNLVMLESDIQYIDAEDINDVEFMSFTSVAEDSTAIADQITENRTKAKINGVPYFTFDEAIAAANAMTGDVVVEIYAKVEYSSATPNLTGAYDSISFVGKTADAEICITRNGSNGYISGDGNDCAVNFEKLILSKPAGSFANDAGFMNVAFSVYRVASASYLNCTFPNGACAAGCPTTYTGCTFGKSNDKYAVWAYGSNDIKIDDCKFDNDRGIKMYAEGAAKTTVIEVTDCDFSQLTGKPAIVLTYGQSITLSGNTYSATGVLELEDNGSSNGTVVVSDDDVTCVSDAYPDGCGVLVDGVIYRTVADAASVAEDGSNVTLLHNSNETVEFAPGVVLDKNGYTADSVTIAKVVATVDGVEYTSLQAALNAAALGSGNVTVEILSDVDLSGIDWNPVSVSAPGYPVVTVNGNDYTITGLNDMLFSGTWAGGSGLIINDLTIANSVIENDVNDAIGTVGVGAFIGYPSASEIITLNNCHLVDSTVRGGHWTGGLIGISGGYSGSDGPVFMNLTIEGCSVTGCTIEGKGSVGGIIGHAANDAWTGVAISGVEVQNNTVTSTGSSTVKAGAVMGTIGAAGQPTTSNGQTLTGGVSVDAVVSGNAVTSNNTVINTVYGRQGSIGGDLEITGGDYEHFPIEDGATYADVAFGTTITVAGTPYTNPWPVLIDGQGYESLADAVDAAQAGDVIVVNTDIVLNDTLHIPAGADIVLDLNGYTISQVKAQTAGYQMILNDGKLTINDSVGSGKISYTDSGNGGEYISDVIYNRATLVINGGTIENISSETVANNGYPHAVDTYSGIRDTSVTINGGTIYCAEYSAIRMFCVSANYKADLVINGGTIKGAIDMQNGTRVLALGSLTINDGDFQTTANANNIRFANWNGGAEEYGIAAAISGGSFNGGITTAYVPAAANFDKQIITGGSFTSAVLDYVVMGATVTIDGESYTRPYAATIDGQGYKTLAAAFAAVGENQTIVITADIDGETVALPATLKNVKVIANDGVVVKNTVIKTPDGVAELDYDGVTFDGVVFDNSRIHIVGWRSNASFKNLTVTNCKFSNIVNGATENLAALHLNVAASERVENLTFTNNTVDGITGGESAALYADVTGNVVVSGNTIKNVSGSGMVISFADADVTITENAIENWATGGKGRAIRCSIPEGTSTLNVVDNTMNRIDAPEEFVKVTGISDSITVVVEDNVIVGNTLSANGLIYLEKVGGETVDAPDNVAVAENQPHIKDGNWWIGDTDTGVKAEGVDGANGVTPHIGANNNWWIGETDTGVKAIATDGETPYIKDGYWYIGGTNTNVKAEGVDGANGVTPHIGTNGNWWIGETDTGVKAQGEQGPVGPQGPQGPQGETGNGIAQIITNTVDGKTTVTIKFTDPTMDDVTFEVKDGAQGAQGIQGIQGVQGATGNGIKSISTNKVDGVTTVTIEFTDASMPTLSFPIADGADGATGATGATGAPGADGKDGADGQDAIYGVDGKIILIACAIAVLSSLITVVVVIFQKERYVFWR